jgi:hypothetical protein
MIAGIGLALLLAACSSNGGTGTASPLTTGVSTTVISAAATTIPYSLAKNARSDVTAEPCTELGGLWVLNGLVTNSAATARTYQIVVDFVTEPGDTVLDTKIVTTTSVKPGASLGWSAKSSAGLHNVACVIRQVQAPA